MNPYKDIEDSSFAAPPHLAYEDIATKLLKDNYFLTALELHTELVESGKELPQLREFFSNPGNFEQHVSRASEFTSMHRSPSQATLDSLDTARYSEDGGGDRGGSGGDVAVLEFELRKARETINSLRANLTQFADGDSTLDKNIKNISNEQSLKPHEQRALNFLVIALETEKLNFQKLYDAAIVSLNSLTSPSSESKGLDLQMPDSRLLSIQTVMENTEERPLTCTAMENHYGSGNSTHSATPEQFEMIDSEKNSVINKKDGSTMSSFDPVAEDASPHHRSSVTTLDETLSMNDAGEWTRVHYEYTAVETSTKEMWIDSSFDPVAEDASPHHWSSVTTLDETLSMNDAGEWTRVHYEYTAVETSTKEIGEVLSCIAELLASRSTERRILASQICVAIAPYVPVELCTSLLLSLVIMMCESNEAELRSLGLKSACLICPVADHKYGQLENLMFSFLKDPAEKCVKDTLAHVINVQIVKDLSLNHCDMQIIQEIPLEEQECFIDLQCYISEYDGKVLLVAMNSLRKLYTVHTQANIYGDYYGTRAENGKATHLGVGASTRRTGLLPAAS
ncbi:LisH domain and HEAT repeat-containing protein [Operophtera brumata]|uniref:LisH domain and HEAT repeat-containing protein n=1 Tax=Operophtera brumata TaxID=104452 RepID=A0A0L7LJH4_OPEBR|nr:LisH domain and HEAT repeat-containing protein [Operophtera brumata]